MRRKRSCDGRLEVRRKRSCDGRLEVRRKRSCDGRLEVRKEKVLRWKASQLVPLYSVSFGFGLWCGLASVCQSRLASHHETVSCDPMLSSAGTRS